MLKETKMWCHINLMIILAVCVPQIYSQANLEDKTVKVERVCGESLILKCTITGIACCTDPSRLWRKSGVRIMENGSEISTSGKYSEDINSAGDYFTLTINDIDESDFGKKFVCSYSFYTSAEFTPIDDFRCAPCYTCGLMCILFACIGMAVMLVMLLASYTIGYCCCQSCCYTRRYCCHKFERPGDFTYKFCGIVYPKKLEKTWLVIKMMFGVIIAANVSTYLIASILIGIYCTSTDICFYSLHFSTAAFGFGLLTFIFYHHWTFKWSFDIFSNLKYGIFMVATYCILPIPFLFLWERYCSANSRKKEDSNEVGMANL